MHFSAAVITGSGRGKDLNCPTLNLQMDAVPEGLLSGVYACRAFFDGASFPATMHFGPRPTVSDTDSCEIHIIDEDIVSPPPSVEVTVVRKMRDIEDFGSLDALKEQLQRDTEQARGILLAP